MTRSNLPSLSRCLSAALLALLTGVGLYVCTLGARWPTLETLPVWGWEAAYAGCIGALHFALWPLWHRRARTPVPGCPPSA